MNKYARVLAAAAMTVALPACGAQPTPALSTTAAPPASGVTAAPEIPGTPAGRQLSWLLDAVSRAPLPASELEQHFAARFLSEIPAEEINRYLVAHAGMELVRLLRSEPNALVAEVTAGGRKLNVSIGVDAAGLIEGLLFQVAEPPPAPRSWAELDERLAALAPRTGFAAAELTANGRCEPVHGVSAGKALPLGSMFKLYVLGAVAKKIENGAFDWDTTLTIKPELRSIGTGGLQDRPDDSEVTVLEAAKLMISISDNTATDLLVHKVGRKAVERTMRAWGARDERNTPLLTTREMFALKGTDYPRHAKRYLSLNPAGQRAYLKNVVAKIPLSEIVPWQEPRELDTLEWFASPADLCEAYAGLLKLDDAHVAAAMSINDAGLDLDRARWPQVWYKGGSEFGLVGMSFMARTSGGKRYVVAVTALAPDAHVTAAPGLLSIARGAFALAAG
jgi:beta-lactamase class A